MHKPFDTVSCNLTKISWSKIAYPPPVPEQQQQQQAERGAALLLQVPDDCGLPRLLQPPEDGQALLCQASRQAEEDCANGEQSFLPMLSKKGCESLLYLYTDLDLDYEPQIATLQKC